MMTLAQAHALLPGSVLVGRGDIVIERVHSDTRTLRAGDLFVALKGERFDGHDYLAQARAAGAVAALAERGLTLESIPGLQVPDSLQGLQRVSAAWRAQFDLPLIAVTGSNGKTTVTQMLAAILRAWHCDAALATAGNFNNHIGVPLTLLRLRATHRCAVLELGMNHAGEIALLARLAAPTVALVNNAQREHQEFMDGVEAVARENGSVFEALPADGVAVVPAGDAFAPLWAHMAGARRLMSFGAGPSAGRQAGVFAEAAVWSTQHAAWMLQLRTPDGPLETRLHLPGAHNLHNALAAATGALAAGAPLAAIAAGIDAFRPVAGRSHTRTLRWRGRRVTLIDDSYNANPDSMLAAIAVLASLPGPRWLLMGDMGEVGAQGPAFHAEVGAAARAAGIEHVWAAGALMAHAGAQRHFADTAALRQALPDAAFEAQSILVKGSRFMQMEQVVQALEQEAARAA